jgi:hypothetical protein
VGGRERGREREKERERGREGGGGRRHKVDFQAWQGEGGEMDDWRVDPLLEREREKERERERLNFSGSRQLAQFNPPFFFHTYRIGFAAAAAADLR